MSGNPEEWCSIGVNGRFLLGECMACSPGDEPLTSMRCYSCGLPQLYEALEGWNSVCG